MQVMMWKEYMRLAWLVTAALKRPSVLPRPLRNGGLFLVCACFDRKPCNKCDCCDGL